MKKFINNNTVVKDDDYSKNKVYIICFECQHILINPFICSNCNYIYCKNCLNEIITCKNCNELDYKRNIFINDILSSLKIKCLICNNNINYYDIKNHYITYHFDENILNILKNTENFELIKLIKKHNPEEIQSLIKQGKEMNYITSK